MDMTFLAVTFVCLSCPLIISIDNENSPISILQGEKLPITKVVLSEGPFVE